jgi:putative Ca2+/H+ antiporter (TMEM165/GDT1 family)
MFVIRVSIMVRERHVPAPEENITSASGAKASPLPARPVFTGRPAIIRPLPNARTMEAFVISTGIVALAEIGDKTQLLAFLLAAKFRKPVPIVLGILVATLANHAFAAALGAWINTLMGPDVMRWVLGISFIAMAGWTLIPDKLDDEENNLGKYGVFATTLIAFFLAEMGDKTQIATVALAARYEAVLAVVAGTTVGMMIANVPAVYFGERIANKISLKLVHGIAAALFLALGIATLLGAGKSFGF